MKCFIPNCEHDSEDHQGFVLTGHMTSGEQGRMLPLNVPRLMWICRECSSALTAVPVNGNPDMIRGYPEGRGREAIQATQIYKNLQRFADGASVNPR